MPPLNDFKDAYTELIGLEYGLLGKKQKQAVYAMEIYNDSQDALTAFDIYSSTTLPANFVDEQCRETFGYSDDTVIKEQ